MEKHPSRDFMAKNMKSIDKVRASRDGHEFHEAWTARKTLQLLLPTDNLIGIAVEGLHPADQAAAASATVEIADITIYYGNNPTFKGAEIVNIVQFKYSIRSQDDDFRASHANTIAVVRIKNNLDFEFYKGAINKILESKY